jgi:hypothetical protein
MCKCSFTSEKKDLASSHCVGINDPGLQLI